MVVRFDAAGIAKMTVKFDTRKMPGNLDFERELVATILTGQGQIVFIDVKRLLRYEGYDGLERGAIPYRLSTIENHLKESKTNFKRVTFCCTTYDEEQIIRCHSQFLIT